MKRILSLLLCAAMAIVCFSGCSAKSNEELEVKTFVIETPYGNLRYPEKWKDMVTIDVDDSDCYVVKFSTDGAPLFDLSFNGGSGYVLGTLKLEEGNAVLRIMSYDFDSESEMYETYCMMQEDVNVILAHLSDEYEFAVGEIIEDEDTSVFAIETPLTTLYYPEKWKERVTVDVLEDVVKFSSEGIPLFDLRLGGDEGALLGSYNGIEIRIISYDMDQNGLSEERFNELCIMQEDVNVILQYLAEDSRFSMG